MGSDPLQVCDGPCRMCVASVPIVGLMAHGRRAGGGSARTGIRPRRRSVRARVRGVPLLRADDGAVRTLTLNRPEARNALNLELLTALRSELAEVLEGDSVRCLVLAAAGKAFCAGADVKDWAESGPQQGPDTWVTEAHALAVELAGAPLPTIAVLNGAAVGAGLDLALACDFRVAADTARFACAYTWMAYPPDVGGTWLLPRLVRPDHAKRFVFTGEFWDAPTALERGLVSEVVPQEGLAERRCGARA